LTPTRFSRSWCQRSPSDGHRILVNPTAHEPAKGFESKLTQILAILGRGTDSVFKVRRHKPDELAHHDGGKHVDNVPCRQGSLF